MITASEKIWMDGKMVAWGEAKIHVLTHALHYGTGVFEGIRAYETKEGSAIFRLPEHVRRLFDSAKALSIKMPFSEKEISDAIIAVVRDNKLSSCYIRPIVFLAYGSQGLNPIGVPVSVSIAAWPWGAYLGEEGVKKGIRAKVSSFTRHHVNIAMTRAKITGNYVNSCLAKQEVVAAGYDEAFMLDVDGYVAECTGENIFVIRDGRIKTPGFTSFLPGITRDSVQALAKDERLEIGEGRITRDDLYMADEIFLTGTAAELTPVREVDDRAIGTGKPGPITVKLRELYNKAIHGELEKHKAWLTMVK
ncbi:MAG: branched-chain amino acid transaminase [archaeon]